MDTILSEDGKHENIDIRFSSTVGIHSVNDSLHTKGTSLAKAKIKIRVLTTSNQLHTSIKVLDSKNCCHMIQLKMVFELGEQLETALQCYSVKYPDF